MKKALILTPRGNDGCTWYRTFQFSRYAKQHGVLNAGYLDTSLLHGDGLAEIIRAADAFIIRLNDTTAYALFDIITDAKTNKPIILDIDDMYDNIDPLSDMYRVYGTSDVKLPDGTYLWKDGEAGFDVAKNVERVMRFHSLIEAVDAVIVTTINLKNYAERFNPNVVIIPNAIDFSLFPRLDIRRDDRVRVLWAGGSTHYPDLIEIAPALKEVMERNTNVDFHILGVPFNGVIKDLPKDRVFPYGWINSDGHGYRLATIHADIGIAPLKKNMEFNHYKSSVKYYEYSALGMATIAANMPPYSDDIQHEVTGMLFNTPGEFLGALQALIDDPVKRLAMGEAAHQYVRRNRDINDISVDWGEFISGVCEAKAGSRDKIETAK
jgi:glycosyltransferase involved in cell wall biosynthesis